MQNANDLGDAVNFAAAQGIVDATPPPTASDAAYVPYDEPLAGTIAGEPDWFTSHGVSVNDLGSFPGGARASQITPDLTNPQLVNRARARDMVPLIGPGTPEPAMGAPSQGAILDHLDDFGVIRLGIGPAVPVLLLAIVAGYWLYSQRGA